ncbi:AAA family ATPase [Candidatus Micrarchaeota archaeon]|nr:AAA family ATPase [Candidatus Micrarchaeota archaeon]
MIIGITGMPLSGKASVRRIFEDMGCQTFVMSSAVRAEMEKHGIEVNKESMREFATKIRQEKGRGVAGELSLPYLRDVLGHEDMVIIDGIRSPEEPEIFKREFGDDFMLICVWAPFKLRAKRLGDPERLKTRSDEVITDEELKGRDKKELSWGLGEVIAMADYLIVNTSGKEDLEKELKRFLRMVVAKGMRRVSEWG